MLCCFDGGPTGPVVERFSSLGGCYYTPHQFIQQGRHRTIFIPMESGEYVQDFKVKWSRTKKSPRREVVRSSAGAGVVYPPFWGSFA